MRMTRFSWYTGRDSNPQPSEPESDALSIEPPVHLLDSLAIIAGFPHFVKGKNKKLYPHSVVVFPDKIWYNQKSYQISPKSGGFSMSSAYNFRSAFNGFNREDVVHYIEYANSNHNNQLNQLNQHQIQEIAKEQIRQ